MTKKIYAILLATLFLCGCYDDKGNYDYTTQEALEITVDGTYFERQVGTNLSIQPTITTKIPDSDLTYQWEVHCFTENTYRFNKFAEGKKLDWTCTTTELMPGIGQYSIRLHATQISTQREFYSKQITLGIVGVTGLVVLHGDDSQCDIGLLVAPEFRGTDVTDETIENYPAMYSQANGEKIQGKGKSIYHLFTSYTVTKGLEDRCYVVALTDQGATLANYAGLQHSAQYEDLFYSADVPHKKPQNFYVSGDKELIVDDGVLFYAKPGNSGSPVHVAPLDNEVQSSLPQFENGIYFSPFVLTGKSGASYTRLIMFNINDRGFVGYSDGSMWPNKYTKLDATAGGNPVPFNPATMNADLLYMDHGGSTNHTMAVMRDDENKKYLVEMDLKTKVLSEMPYAKYDNLDNLKDFDQANFYAFGEDQFHMCYYSTSNAVYRYSVESGKTPQSELLMTVGGQTIDFKGAEITMMKILKPNTAAISWTSSWSYKYYNQMLLVGTYANGEGTLRAFIVDQSSGRVLSETSYTGFDKIYDAAVKGL